ncbi:MAG: CBS domain-containing protein [Nitrososphaeraceae archaeon]
MGLESISLSSCMTINVKMIPSDKGLFNVCRIMKDDRIGSVIVVDESRHKNPIGIITERDIVNYLSSPEGNLLMQVKEIMSKPLITALETQSLLDALQTMQNNNFRRLPIINKEGKLVGIVTDKDIFKAIIKNKDLVSDLSKNSNLQLSQSTLEKYKEYLVKIFSIK